MNLKQTIRKVLFEHNKGKDKKVRDIILNATEWDDFLSALAVKYGDTVPLYHATTKETAEIIDREGFKLTYGKNYKSFTPEELIYFQIGHSDYQASNRPVVYRLDVPIDFIAEFADIDMDNVDISDEDLADVGVDMEYFEEMSYEIKDAIRYYVWNNMTLDGMELLITDRNNVGNIFKGLTPVKVSELNESILREDRTIKENLTVVVGGCCYATPEWMKSQWIAAGLPLKGVKFIDQKSTSLPKLKNEYNVNKIMGFSGGGSIVWNEINSSAKQYIFIGLIDPVTPIERNSLPSNVYTMTNSNNWGKKYITTKSNMAIMEKKGVYKRVNMEHRDIPLYFFKVYKDKII